jgi:hypothetical protein
MNQKDFLLFCPDSREPFFGLTKKLQSFASARKKCGVLLKVI